MKIGLSAIVGIVISIAVIYLLELSKPVSITLVLVLVTSLSTGIGALISKRLARSKEDKK